MINPGTYEGYANELAIAGEGVVLSIGRALTRLWRRAIRNPDDLPEAAFLSSVNKAANTFNTEWKQFADDDLARAYLRGIGHTEAEINQISKKVNVKPASQTISQKTPMIRQQGLSSPPPPIPRRIRNMFSKYPDHLTFYGVFRRAAYFNL